MLELARYSAAGGGVQRRLVLQPLGQVGLYLVDHVAVVRVIARPEQQERVQRIAMARGVDTCVGDTVIDLFEIAANARKQVALIARIDHHLQTFAYRRQARFHHRTVGIDAIVQGARLPGDVLRVMAQEIGHVELAP